jgi:PAS domain S-box-containing protein
VELREANQRLASEMARISTLVDEMGDGVIATDGSDNIVLLNNVAEEMFGLRARGAIGKPVLAVVEHPGLVDLFAMPLSPHGGAYATEISLDEESSRVVRAHIALVEEPGEEMAGKCAVFTDITHLKELDRMKMDLISFVSHELKNPITSLQGVCELMSGRMSQDDERTARLMEIATRQSGRMQHLVQDFLDLSRIEAGQELELNWSEVADAAELLGSALALAARGGPEHTFETEVAEDMGPFWVDRGKLESVLINLVENAVKYSPEGGRVALRVFADDGNIVFEVRDEGVGIQEADLPKLFKSFQRVHDGTFGRVSGTGVGLYVCRHIVEAHGGEIEVESTWGAGSTFRLRLPHCTGPPEER